jgi:uncharacterized protein
MNCFFVSDLHGKLHKYHKLIEQIRIQIPDVLFIGGDILPHAFLTLNDSKYGVINDFIIDFIFPLFEELKNEMGNNYPDIFIILGNDDPKVEESKLIDGEKNKLWRYIHNKKFEINNFMIFGYANIPPTPFQLKDWELYDVSRFVDPGSIPPTEGRRSVIPDRDIEYATIQNDLEELTENENLDNAIFLFHSPPYQTKLDRANLDGKMIDYIPLDVHIGSIAIQRFIEEKQPLLTLHGHVHESSTLTGCWSDKIGETMMFSAAYEKDNLVIIHFDTSDMKNAKRLIV